MVHEKLLVSNNRNLRLSPNIFLKSQDARKQLEDILEERTQGGVDVDIQETLMAQSQRISHWKWHGENNTPEGENCENEEHLRKETRSREVERKRKAELDKVIGRIKEPPTSQQRGGNTCLIL
eukprot:gb/GECG01011382.1/.p1 GENE.gb/GECG01011382.1/~~gb/GECG01011382.1/.p1  ORF type:complete len:123 (+),score=21.38 gb/GECG01011382.1/:1-369(+)